MSKFTIIMSEAREFLIFSSIKPKKNEIVKELYFWKIVCGSLKNEKKLLQIMLTLILLIALPQQNVWDSGTA